MEVNMMVLTKQALYQCLLYIVAFFLVYLAPIIVIFQRIFGNGEQGAAELRFWLSALFTPIGGVFNILIYTRPKVLKMREKYPHVTSLGLFLVIVLTGGDIPSMADVRPKPPTSEQIGNLERNYHNEEKQEDASKSSNDDVSSNIVFNDIDVSRASEYLSRDLSFGSSVIL